MWYRKITEQGKCVTNIGNIKGKIGRLVKQMIIALCRIYHHHCYIVKLVEK